MLEAENHVLPGATTDSWRTWLMTGARRAPADRRRVRGEHVGLKRMLLEGRSDSRERPHAWNDFSGAMVRHAIDEAMRSLPREETQVVKLAYFGGYSNKQIAEQVGLTEATVQRRLKRALSSISASIQRGRVLARRAMYAVTLWLSGRWLGETTHHFVQSVAVVATAVVVVSQPAPLVTVAPTRDSRPSQTTTVTTSAPTRTTVVPGLPSPSILVVTVPQVPSVGLPPVKLPISLPTPTPLPPLNVKPPV